MNADTPKRKNLGRGLSALFGEQEGDSGEAGAASPIQSAANRLPVELLAPDLPQPASGHNSYWDWGPPAHDPREVIAVGFAQIGSAFLSRFLLESLSFVIVFPKFRVVPLPLESFLDGSELESPALCQDYAPFLWPKATPLEYQPSQELVWEQTILEVFQDLTEGFYLLRGAKLLAQDDQCFLKLFLL